MKIYYNWCGDGHIKIIKGEEEIGMEYSFLVDTNTNQTCNGKILGTFDEISNKLNRLIELGLKIDIGLGKNACYVIKRQGYYTLHSGDVYSITISLRDLLLKKKLWDFVMSKHLNNKNFINSESDVESMILDIYKGKDVEYKVLNYIKC